AYFFEQFFFVRSPYKNAIALAESPERHIDLAQFSFRPYSFFGFTTDKLIFCALGTRQLF
ncbi:MAG: hypothetical protein PHH26_08585, partial [Candidatus Thermoplasmatota archaeon]|nr:hypothetical protein [Candidatus Thermoplasmatota archaeon]